MWLPRKIIFMVPFTNSLFYSHCSIWHITFKCSINMVANCTFYANSCFLLFSQMFYASCVIKMIMTFLKAWSTDEDLGAQLAYP